MDEETLRMVLYEVPMVFYLTMEGFRRPVGPSGSLIYSTWGNNIEGMNITYSKPSDENNFGRDLGNNNWTGLVGMIQNGIVDTSLTTLTMLVSTNVVSYIPVADVSEGTIFTLPVTNICNVQILEAFNVFEKCVWYLLLASIISVATWLYVQSKQYRFYIYIMETYRFYINQVDIKKYLWKSTIVTLTFLIGSFVFFELYENLLHTDIVAKDTSKIVNCIEDLQRVKQYKPYFIENEIFTQLIASGRKQIYRDIWSRVVKDGPKKTVLPFDPTALPKPEKGHMAFIGKQHYTEGLSRMMCGLARSLSVITKLWTAPEAFAEINEAYIINKDLSSRKKSVLAKRAHRLAETGLTMAFWKSTTKPITGILSSYSCEADKIDDLFPDTKDNRIVFVNMTSLAIAYFALIAVVLRDRQKRSPFRLNLNLGAYRLT